MNYSRFLKHIIFEVLSCGKALDKVLEKYFRNFPPASPALKEELFTLASFMVRYWLTIQEIHERIAPRQEKDFQLVMRIARIMDATMQGQSSFREKTDQRIGSIYLEMKEDIRWKASLPDWLALQMEQELGEYAVPLANELNEIPRTIMRANRLKTDVNGLIHALGPQGKVLRLLENYPDAVWVTRYFDIFRSAAFQNGLFEMQDAGSQRIAPFLDVAPGMRVVDACCGNGGKTLHLAGLMANKGRIIAMDIYDQKLETLKKRMKRAGAFNIETRLIESSKTIKRLQGSADRLLLDVPCSGTGVLKRNPDIKYHLAPEKLQHIRELQSDILDRYSVMLASRGIMVYATCSILPSENSRQVKDFLQRQDGKFTLMDEEFISPLEGYDGFYMARLQRN